MFFIKKIQFPIEVIYNKRNDNSCSENIYIDLASGQRMDLGLKEVTLYPARSIQYHDDKHTFTFIQKFQNDNVPFRMCVDSLLDSVWIERLFPNIAKEVDN
jgi:hypothetical protein